MTEDAGRGYRRVVPSPRPMAPIEADAISAMVDLGYIVVAGGGGGIPVCRSADGAYRGVDAVIDKDFAAERIADAVGAQALVMVTGVAAVRLHFGTPQEQSVGGDDRVGGPASLGRRAVPAGEHGTEGGGGHRVRGVARPDIGHHHPGVGVRDPRRARGA